MRDRTSSNEQLVRRGYDHLYGSGNVDAIADLIRDDFVDHNPFAPSGKNAAIEFLRQSPLSKATAEVKRIIADEQYVVAHSHVHFPGDDNGRAVVDIWRVEDDLIAEHWDVVQPVPDGSSDHVGMF